MNNYEKARDEIRTLIQQAQEGDVIDDLLDIQLRIAGNLVFVQQGEAAAHSAFVVAVNHRKVKEAELVRKNRERGMGVGESQELAKEQAAPQRRAEAAHEAEYKDFQTFRIVVSEFLDGLRQKLSFMKQEWQRAHQGDNTVQHSSDDRRYTP